MWPLHPMQPDPLCLAQEASEEEEEEDGVPRGPEGKRRDSVLVTLTMVEKWKQAAKVRSGGGGRQLTPLPRVCPSFISVIWGCAGSGLHSLLHSETRASACTFLLSFSPGLPEVHCGEDVVSVSLLVGGGRAILRALQWFLQGKERTERENSRYHLELVIVQIRDPSPVPCGPSRRILDSLCSLHVAK